jgi:hypothetical protein
MIGNAWNRFESWRVLSNKSALNQEKSDVGQVIVFSEGFDIADQLVLRRVGKRVFDSKGCQNVCTT